MLVCLDIRPLVAEERELKTGTFNIECFVCVSWCPPHDDYDLYFVSIGKKTRTVQA